MTMFGIVIYRVRMYPDKGMPSMAELLAEKRRGNIFEVSESPVDSIAEIPEPEWVLGLQRPGSRLTRVKRRWPA